MAAARTTGAHRGGLLRPEVTFLNDTHAVGLVRGAVMVAAHGPARTDVTRAIREAETRVAARDGASVVIILVDKDRPPADDEGRVALRDLLSQLDPSCLGFALCFEGEGFAAAAKRSVSNLVIMSVRTQLKARIFSSAMDGATWLVPLLGDKGAGLTPLALAAALEQMRKDLVAGAITMGRPLFGDPSGS